MTVKDKRGEEVELSERSNVQIGLVIGIVAFVCGAVWWAATIQAKLDTMVTLFQEFQKSNTHLITSYQEIANRVTIIDKTGTEALRELQEEIDRLSKAVEKQQ